MASSSDKQQKPIEEVLSFPILLSDRILAAADAAGTFVSDCAAVAKQVDSISHMIRSTARFAATAPSLYERPVRRILAEVTKTLARSLALVRRCKCRRRVLLCLRRVSRSDFRKLHLLLDASASDLRWLLGVLDRNSSSGSVLSLPPIATTDPILSFVWSSIGALHGGGELSGKVEAARELCLLARESDRNRKVIVEEGGVLPLLNLLKETSLPDAQIAAANALFEVADSSDTVGLIGKEVGVFSVLVQVLGKSPMKVQIRVVNVISRMVELGPELQEDFARESVIRPLVKHLSFETFMDGEERNPTFIKITTNKEPERNSENSNVRYAWSLSKEMERDLENLKQGRRLSWSWSFCSDGSNGNYRKERENEDPEVKHKLKIACAEALWMLTKGNALNSRRLTETKGLLCLAKLVEKSEGELQSNCLMAIMEIAAAAELCVDLRDAAFRSNSPAAKAVVEQLLRLIKQFDTPSLQIPAIKSIGSLARIFPAREIRIITLLVEQLCNANQEVATEGAISLGKFACPENFLCVQHSNTIIESNGVPPLMKLLRACEKAQLHSLILLCYLAMHAGNTQDMEQARLLITLEGVDRTVVSQNHELRELVPKAIYHLNLYQTGVHPPSQPHAHHAHKYRFGMLESPNV